MDVKTRFLLRPASMQAPAGPDARPFPAPPHPRRAGASPGADWWSRRAAVAPTRSPQRLPWPQAVLVMGSLSLALWALIAAVAVFVIR